MSVNLESLKLELSKLDQTLIKSFNILEEQNSKNDETKLAEIKINVCGRPVELTVGFPKHFPNELPLFFDNKHFFGRIPHKMPSKGFICYTRNESLLIDTRYPASILLNCLEKVVSILEEGVRGENKDDFINEFESYWQFKKDSLDVYAHIDTSKTNVRELNLWSNKVSNSKEINKSMLFVSTEKKRSIKEIVERFFHINLNNAIKYRCLYIPLKEGASIFPPVDRNWGFIDLKNKIFSNLTRENQMEFKRLASKRVKGVDPKFEFIIVGLPTPNGNVSLFGCLLDGARASKNVNKSKLQIHPFVQKAGNDIFSRLIIKRWHPNYLLNRTGGNTELMNKHILIAGVGSVGSEIAIRFAKAGAKKLTLVDKDKIEVENIHRHALGSDQVFSIDEENGLTNKYKVIGIKEEINRKYPFTEVKTYCEDVFKVLDKIDISKDDIDLFVVAIGSPNIEMMINQKLLSLPKPPPTIYTWVEPLGIGGHTLVTLNGEKKGCYQCLFKPDEEGPIYNRSSFAMPFQDFSKDLTGCGSAFTPYNFLDSERSAMLTVETGIKVMMGKLLDNPLLSWKGEDELFKESGYKTTPRYSFSNEQLNKTRLLYKDDSCPICSNERRDIHQ